MAKAKKLKSVNFKLIEPPKEGEKSEPYELLAEVRREWHKDTAEAKIALAWRTQLKPDTDGRLMVGRCCRASELQRELIAWDFVILLNAEAWSEKEFTRERKLALLDHEMCHVAQALDKKTGKQRYDERIRPIWRTRGHDIEEFRAVVARHGTYKRDLERFAEALLKQKTELFAESPQSAQMELAAPAAAASPQPERSSRKTRAKDSG